MWKDGSRGKLPRNRACSTFMNGVLGWENVFGLRIEENRSWRGNVIEWRDPQHGVAQVHLCAGDQTAFLLRVCLPNKWHPLS